MGCSDKTAHLQRCPVEPTVAGPLFPARKQHQVQHITYWCLPRLELHAENQQVAWRGGGADEHPPTGFLRHAALRCLLNRAVDDKTLH